MTAVYLNFARTEAYFNFYLLFTPFHMAARSAFSPIPPVGIFLPLPLYFFCSQQKPVLPPPKFARTLPVAHSVRSLSFSRRCFGALQTGVQCPSSGRFLGKVKEGETLCGRCPLLSNATPHSGALVLCILIFRSL